jgi:hypothetical protein
MSTGTLMAFGPLIIMMGIPLGILLAWLKHMHDLHGLGPLLWRWHTGNSLDGHPRTNATWLHRSSDTLHHTGHAIWWHHRPRLWRAAVRCGTELVLTGILTGIGAGLWLAPGVTVPLLLALVSAAVAGGIWWAARNFRNVYFYWRWVRPLKRALELHHGIPPKLKISPDRSSVQLSLPPGWADTQRERDKVTALVTSRLGIEIDPDNVEDAAFKTRARAPHVLFTAAVPPPDRVNLSDPDVRAIVAQCRDAGKAQVFAGYGSRRKEISPSVDTDSPHVGVSMGSGDGKSVTAGNAASQLAAQGSLIAILDYKIISHLWAKKLPNVAYASRPWQIHELLMWLEAEIASRNDIVDARAELGRVSGFGFPRLVVIAEELNATMKVLKRHWRECRAQDRSLPAQSPAVEGLEMLLFLGRQVNINVIAIGQRLSAAAVSSSGSADARENLGLRYMCDPGPATWRMLGPETPCPKPWDHPGRHYLVSRKEPLAVQTVFGTDAEFRALAVSGDVAVPPVGMPFVHRDGGYQRADDDDWTWRADVIQVPELVSAGGGPRTGSRTQGWSDTARGTPGPVLGQVLDAELVGEAVQAGAQDEMVTLSEACDLGIAKVNLAAARRRSTRDSRHPASQGKRGREFLYAAIDLADYYARAA